MVLHYSCEFLSLKHALFNLLGYSSLCVQVTPQISFHLSYVLQTMMMTSVAQGCHQWRR